MNFERPIVLILSSDPAFARNITTNWPQDVDLPEFVVLDQGLCDDLSDGSFDLAIADVSSEEKYAVLRRAAIASGKPILAVRNTSSSPNSGHTSIVELNRSSLEWGVAAALVGREMLRRGRAEAQVREAERLCAAAEAEATLGRYMSEMRHNVNNALTTVLGNAELLLLEHGLPAHVLAQADTIRNMALRIHEVFQRFSSIEKELRVVARESGKKTHSAAAGSASLR